MATERNRQRGLTYDAAALIAADRGDRAMRSRHEAALEIGIIPTVPASVLAQVWRGGPQPLLSRVLRGCRIEELTETAARAAGALCGLAGLHDSVDAVVVEGALRRNDAVVTSDPDDLRTLADAAGRTVPLLDV